MIDYIFVFNLISRYEQSVGTNSEYLKKLDFLTMEILLEVYIKSDPDIPHSQESFIIIKLARSYVATNLWVSPLILNVIN